MSTDITITRLDKERIRNILGKKKDGSQPPEKIASALEQELRRATVVDSREVPRDVITMNSRALLSLYGEDVEVSLVYPSDADLDAMKLSVFSPIGMAILGYREGSTIRWEVPSGTSEIHIKKILYQPEAAGDYHI